MFCCYGSFLFSWEAEEHTVPIIWLSDNISSSPKLLRHNLLHLPRRLCLIVFLHRTKHWEKQSSFVRDYANARWLIVGLVKNEWNNVIYFHRWMAGVTVSNWHAVCESINMYSVTPLHSSTPAFFLVVLEVPDSDELRGMSPINVFLQRASVRGHLSTISCWVKKTLVMWRH